ncbi:uncharacterized protein LOC111699116 [Eurytemora carolleeae]|uniref:uncharacterized protein LOC111699116 n=1 Tax=Eurytemora carolleeae TaxID=1294199 RepID=UPI000C77B37D|nr:uncharacterized protein LOC111699116 [Eurytemora carolleeae]|eukprot:XP_023325458.1 uncharacterized protein LOC111699116 [Eurytemora affinis]
MSDVIEEDEISAMSGDSDVYATDGEKKETSLFAAVRIARWMARAYGYMAKKKESYKVEQMYGSTVEIQKIQRMDSEEEIVDDEDIDLSPTTGDPDKDMEKVCMWYAKMYGQRNAMYHEAYNDELYRQAKMLN